MERTETVESKEVFRGSQSEDEQTKYLQPPRQRGSRRNLRPDPPRRMRPVPQRGSSPRQGSMSVDEEYKVPEDVTPPPPAPPSNPPLRSLIHSRIPNGKRRPMTGSSGTQSQASQGSNDVLDLSPRSPLESSDTDNPQVAAPVQINWINVARQLEWKGPKMHEEYVCLCKKKWYHVRIVQITSLGDICIFYIDKPFWTLNMPFLQKRNYEIIESNDVATRLYKDGDLVESQMEEGNWCPAYFRGGYAHHKNVITVQHINDTMQWHVGSFRRPETLSPEMLARWKRFLDETPRYASESVDPRDKVPARHSTEEIRHDNVIVQASESRLRNNDTSQMQVPELSQAGSEEWI